MIKKLLFLLVLLLTATTGAMAQTTYKVSVKEGTEDATSWTIAPAEATTAGVAAGTTVTATYSGVKKVKSVKAVKKAAVLVTSITLNKTETSIKVGATETLSVTAVAPDNATDPTYTWKTSDETKATVDQDGKVTAVAAGTVTIYAEANDGSGVKGNCAVTVTPAVAEGHALSQSEIGEIVGTDGNVYAVADKDNLPEGVTAVAMVAYKSATTGKSLAIALADEGSMNWNSARSTCGGKTAIGGKSWKLPTMDEWNQMFSANGGNEEKYTGLNNALSAAGGASSTLQNSEYWSSSEGGEYDEDRGYEEAYRVELYGGNAYWDTKRKNQSYRVRAVLAF